MLEAMKLLVAAALAWAAVALVWQVLVAWGGGRRDFSRRAGAPWRGVAYNFTTAMLPSHKESARLHPLEFAVGVALHAGVFLCLLDLVLVASWSAAHRAIAPGLWPVLAAAGPASLYLLVRRLASRTLRWMSSPDDFLAITAVIGLLGTASLHALDVLSSAAFLGYGALLLAYLPLGKLRHAVFFFAARADYGWRLGHRGVYPVSRPRLERSHAGHG